MKNIVTPTARRESEKQELRQKILNTAREMFAELGYEEVTMREIARRIGYTATTLYYHFPDKRALMMELCDRDFLALAIYLRKIGHIEDPVERIRKMSLAYVKFGIEHPSHYHLMFMTRQEKCDPETTTIERGDPNEDAYAFLQGAVAEAHLQGRFRSEFKDPEMVAQALWAAVHGVVALHLAKGNDRWIDWRSPVKTAKMQTDALLLGLLKEKED